MKRKIFRVLFAIMLVLSLSLVMAAPVYAANLVVTAGTSVDIDADTNGGAYTSLNNIAFTDPTPDLALNDTFDLTAPTGFEFLPTAVADQAIGDGYGTTDINLGTGVGTAAPPVYSGSDTVATWTVTAAGVGAGGSITISGMMIRPTLAKTAIVSDGTANVTIAGSATIFDISNAHPIDHVPGALNNFLVEAQGGGNIGAQTVGAAFPIQITARDQHNNTLNDGTNFFDGAGNTVDITSNVAISAGGGTSGVFTAGVLNNHSMTLTGVSAAATITATDSVGGLGSGTETGISNAFIITLGAASKFTLNAPADITAGGRAAYTVTLTDAGSNPVNATTDETVYLFTDSTGADAAFYDAASGGNVITSGTIANGSSTADFWYYDRQTGDWTITASDADPADDDTGYDDATDDLSVTRTGGGGGWTPPAPSDVDTNLFGGVSTFEISASGEVQETITATSAEGDLTLTIPEDTVALDEDGNPLSTLDVDVDVTPPAPPAGDNIIGLPYDFGPSGATFNPSITLEFTYDPAEVPEGAELVIAYYDEVMGMWRELPSTVDPVTYTVTASVSHFTTFAIIARTPEAPPEAPPPVEAPPEAPPPEAPPPEAPPEAAPPAAPPEEAPPGVNWAMVGPIIGVAVFLAIFLPIRRRRRSK